MYNIEYFQSMNKNICPKSRPSSTQVFMKMEIKTKNEQRRK